MDLLETEYGRQYTWKVGEKAIIDVVALNTDHLNTNAPALPFQYRSEYKSQFGSNVKVRREEAIDESIQTDEIAIPPISASPNLSAHNAVISVHNESQQKLDRENHSSQPLAMQVARSDSPAKKSSSPTRALPEEAKQSERVGSTRRLSINSEIYPHTERMEDKNNLGLKYQGRAPMSQYGAGNVNPTVPKNLMKTFNVKAPRSEVYRNTQEKGMRVKDFEAKRPISGAPLPDPKVVLAEYMKARDVVKQIQTQYKTEYKRQFLDWSKPRRQFREDPRDTGGPKTHPEYQSKAGLDSIPEVKQPTYDLARETLARASSRISPR